MDKQRLTYEGLFVFRDFYRMLDEFLEDKGYERRERRNAEVTKPEGKYIEILLEPFKKLSDYAKSGIIIRIIVDNMVDKVIEKEGHKVNMQHGRIQFVFDAYVETDYENRWETKPWMLFMRILWDKYVYTGYFLGFANEVRADFSDVYNQITAYLNLYKR